MFVKVDALWVWNENQKNDSMTQKDCLNLRGIWAYMINQTKKMRMNEAKNTADW